ncbi:MAG: rhamnulokinase family protein [Anaerolineales bacterium]
MTRSQKFLAFDLGAESGRAILGSMNEDRIDVEEIHRFANSPVQEAGHLHWDASHLWSEIQTGLAKAVQRHGSDVISVGVDTWGVDFGLLAADDSLLGNPYHYRDDRTAGMLERAFARVPREEIYARTGIQFMQLNSLYQLLAMAGTPALAAARTFLNMPDLFNFWLTGRKASEFTIATTTQCYDPRQGGWAEDLLRKLDLPADIFQPVLAPGTVLETLQPAVADSAGCGRLTVVAVGSHDTASAAAAVPAADRDWLFLSSGTWSLLGAEVDMPVITPQSLAHDFTNEGGVDGKFLFLKNIMGMWLLQECRREWSGSGSVLSYDELIRLAAKAPAFGPIIVPCDPRYLAPGGMPGRIRDYCRETGQQAPQTQAEIARCIFESLALEYRRVAEQLAELLGRRFHTIHIVGGGCRNRILNQFTADSTGCAVVAGPAEATALGNILAQAVATGRIASLAEGRAVLRRSVETTVYHPGNKAAWDEVYSRYIRMADA